MAKKLTRIQAAKLREEYLLQREQLLQAKVDKLAVQLYEMVFNQYLSALEQRNGNLVMNGKNTTMVRGLDAIYKTFRNKYNAAVVRSYVDDINGIIPLNEQYFNAITAKPTAAAALKATRIVNKGLGLTNTGKIVPGGFVDKFIRDETVIKAIKKRTTQALTQGKSFQQFRVELKEAIEGVQDKPLSGGLQQYYRNNLYDTYAQVDRIASDELAEDLGMKWFFYNGGIINDSRNFCIRCNGKLINAQEFGKLTVNTLKPPLREGIEWKKETIKWNPLRDLGRFACRHRKDYVPDELAESLPGKILNIETLKV